MLHLKLRVAVQGGEASYHDQAARKLFGWRRKMLYCSTFKEVFSAVAAGQADRGIVAVANSVYGPIAEVHKLLQKYAAKLAVPGQTDLPIHHCLIGLPGSRLEDIKTVHSQYMAIGQCKKFLKAKLPNAKIVNQPDTAMSAALIKKNQDLTAAAIASAVAARLHKLHILQANVEDDPRNRTTFVVLKKL